ncbi:MAG TPA: hypothetical protein VMQ52_01665 [Candidatus Saccharimonadales bacterium]|jgi:hypothetical protein|nr:hypothetical protein [Candidatus Saccharimonadales bacterium]
MKDKDIVVIISIVIVSSILSYVIASKVITTPANRQQHVPMIAQIVDQISQPSPTYFNAQSVDPTKLIYIGNNANPAPFNNQASQ